MGDARDVPGGWDERRLVVVGDDGSESAADALRFAAAEARRRDSALRVVRAWSITTAIRRTGSPGGYVPSMDELQEATLSAERDRVEHIIGADPGMPVEVVAVRSPSAQALLAESHDADLLVVGSRGRGGFKALVLGSVAEQCVRHANVPVVVVRPHHEPGPGTRRA